MTGPKEKRVHRPNDMFHRASNYVVVKSNWKSSGGAAFATRADDTREYDRGDRGGRGGRSGRSGRGGRGGRGGGKGGRGGDGPAKEKSSTDKSKADGDEKQKKARKPVICYNCDEEGHMSYNCPHDSRSSDFMSTITSCLK